MSKTASYFASIHNGDIHSITYSLPAHELTENQIELTKEEYYLLKSVQGADGNVVSLAQNMLTRIANKIIELQKSNGCTCNAYQLENYGCKCGRGENDK